MQVGWLGKEGRGCSCRWVGSGRRGESACAGGLVEGGGESLLMQVGWLRGRGESACAGGLVEGGGESLLMQVGWLGEEGRVCSCRWVGRRRRGESAHAGLLVGEGVVIC